MKKLTLSDITVTLSVTSCEINAFDDLHECMSRAEIKSLLTRADSNTWEWCNICLTGTFKGLTAHDYLGASSYKSEQDFIDASDYYADMIDTVLTDLQTQVAEIVAAVA